MFTMHIASMIRTEGASLCGSGMARPSGNGRFITADNSFDLSESIITLLYVRCLATISGSQLVRFY